MKEFTNCALLIITVLIINKSTYAQGVSINTSGANPDTSAILDVSSNDKGMLIPRLTTAERNAISSPAHALIIFNLSSNCFEIYNSNISQWVSGICIGCQLPGSFIATNGGNITSSSFYANWNASPAASTYYLDVATDAVFTSFVSGYNNLNVGNVTTYNVTGLSASTAYYYRVRAGNACGIGSYSNTISVNTSSSGGCGGLTSITDVRDGKIYPVVEIGTQCWMAKNLNYGTYVTVPTGQGGAGTQKYCYGNDTANCTIYGGLYEWAEIMDNAPGCNGTSTSPPCPSLVQGICPSGWHVPSHYEWTLLEKNSGSNPGAFPYDVSTINWLGTDEGRNLKETGCTHWVCGGTAGTNSTGFTAFGGGFTSGGSSHYFNDNGNWWSCTDYDTYNAWYRGISYFYGTVYRDKLDKLRGHSARCVKD